MESSGGLDDSRSYSRLWITACEQVQWFSGRICVPGDAFFARI